VAIAKFPSAATDEWDVTQWEAVALSLARAAGVRVPHFEVHTVDGRTVLILDRFDRAGSLRIGYVSAMTMLEVGDGDRGSYMEIADVIEEQSPRAGDDLCELWRRMVFSVLISNTDDQLRNHGFLRTSSGGWELSPAFDLNPNPDPGPKHLSTALDEQDTAARVATLLRVAPYFRLDEERALDVLSDVSKATDRWRSVAATAGLDRAAVEQMAPAFEHEAAAEAREIATTSRAES
jgi:serine/threonine-protein kinase HipA